jgi:hypothetical protein
MRTTITFALAVSFASLSLAHATEDAAPATHPYHHHHHRYHSLPAVREAPAAQRPGEAVENGFPQTNPMFKPYAHPGEGDNDGISRDPDDCMKGCIGDNPG